VSIAVIRRLESAKQQDWLRKIVRVGSFRPVNLRQCACAVASRRCVLKDCGFPPVIAVPVMSVPAPVETGCPRIVLDEMIAAQPARAMAIETALLKEMR
jgi:hypothetical protein